MTDVISVETLQALLASVLTTTKCVRGSLKFEKSTDHSKAGMMFAEDRSVRFEHRLTCRSVLDFPTFRFSFCKACTRLVQFTNCRECEMKKFKIEFKKLNLMKHLK